MQIILKNKVKRNKFNKNYYFGGVYDDYDTFLDYRKLTKDLIKRYDFVSFLDIGCGCGNLVKEVKKQLENKYRRNFNIQGIDPSDFAVKRAGVPFVRLADCTRLPYKNSSFDLVYILTTFSYLETPIMIEKAMTEAYRTSRKIIVFEDVYTIPKKQSDDYDQYRNYIFSQKQWIDMWKKVIDKNDKIKTYKEEIIIIKNEP